MKEMFVGKKLSPQAPVSRISSGKQINTKVTHQLLNNNQNNNQDGKKENEVILSN